MGQDEQFVEALRARADAAVPRVEVALDRVVPRARRRRRTVRVAAGATSLALVVGGTWSAGAMAGVGPGRAEVLPASGGDDVTASPVPEPTPDAAPDAVVPSDAVVADDGTVTGVPGDPWPGDEPYWYTLSESHEPDGTVRRTESWTSRERPGVWMANGDPATAWAAGPTVVLGSFVIDGRRHDMLTDPRALPTDPAALEQVLRDSTQPGVRSGTEDDKVMGMAHDAMLDSALLPRDLREAFWQAAQRVPGVQVVPGESLGRPAEVLTYRNVGTSGSVELVRDPATGLLYEGGEIDTENGVVLEMRPSGPPPVDPTLAIAGCAEWRSC